jgi:plastocyanin
MDRYSVRSQVAALALGVTLLAMGCAKAEKSENEGSGAKPVESHETEGQATGKIIVVEAYSDANGNYFKPNEIEAHRGDVLRFTLKAGVHNVNFLPDSNPGKTGLPAASDLLQLPDQTYDVKVTFAKGRYYFQCDPHAALGMKGHVKVED